MSKLYEKAVSKSQRRTAAMAKGCKTGKIDSDVCDYPAVKQMSKMDMEKLDKFAKTKEKKLPEKKVSESISFIQFLSMFN